MIWIPILDPDYRYRPTKTISLVGKGWEYAPGLSVCLYSLSVCDLARLLGFRACRRSSMIGRAKNVPEPMSCREGHYRLSATIPSCWGFHNRLSIFTHFFTQPYDFWNICIIFMSFTLLCLQST